MEVSLQCPNRCIAEIMRHVETITTLVDISLQLEGRGCLPLFHKAEQDKVYGNIKAVTALDVVVFQQGKRYGNLINDKGRIERTTGSLFSTPYKGLGAGAELKVDIFALTFPLEENLHTAVCIDFLVMLGAHASELRFLYGESEV